METGAIPVHDLPGGLDLQVTLESGQSYLWDREDGKMYDDARSTGGSAWYHTVLDGELIRARQIDGFLEWESTTDAHPLLVKLLRLEDDLDEIAGATPSDPLADRAFAAYPGLRVVDDPPFPCLVSFICSAQMRVSRIHGMQREIARAFGDTLEIEGQTYYAFPTPTQLTAATESELRGLGLGYRAPYVQATAELIATGEATPDDARGLSYEAARDALQVFVGVGEKVADCVLLFSLGYLEAIPLDTWIRSAIETHYPHCNRGSYAETSRALREQFGGEYAGYAQTYVFHYLRTGGPVRA